MKHLKQQVNLIADEIVKQKPVIGENSINFEEVIIPPEKKRGNVERIKTIIIKMEHYKISQLLNDSTVSKFVTKNGSKYIIYQVANILLKKI